MTTKEQQEIDNLRAENARLRDALRALINESVAACEAMVLSRDVGGPRITGTSEMDAALARAALAARGAE